jgi:hypothetical protein
MEHGIVASGDADAYADADDADDADEMLIIITSRLDSKKMYLKHYFGIYYF